jgi:P27 family predicted phage terminase small subunit
MKVAKAPNGLGAQGKRLWKKILSEYELTESHDLARLEMACRTLDNLHDAEDRVRRDGMFTENRYGNIVEHPAVKSIKDFRLLFVKIIRELSLDIVQPGDSRPPGKY